MQRSFIMHHCFAVVWRRSLELNPCRIKFIKNQGVALWQRRRRRVRRRNRRARELRLEHREISICQAAGPEFGRFRLCCSKKQTGRTVADRQVSPRCPNQSDYRALALYQIAALTSAWGNSRSAKIPSTAASVAGNASARPELENSQDQNGQGPFSLRRKFIIEPHFSGRKSLL
jgi:hypothetical protein